MTTTSTITSKGQVTIPAYLREELGLQPQQRVIFLKEKDQVYFKKIPGYLEIAGSLKSKKPFNIKAMTRTAQKYVADQYAKKLAKGY